MSNFEINRRETRLTYCQEIGFEGIEADGS